MRIASRLVFTSAILACAGCASDGSGLLTTGGIDLTPRDEAAKTDKAGGAVQGLIPGLPVGYICPFVPNGFDPVGSIYRIDRSGTYFRVADLSNDERVLDRIRNNVTIGNYAFNHREKASADLSVSLLKRVLPGFSAEANANKEFNVDITVSRIHAKMMYDTEADYIRQWFSRRITPKPGSRYFLVREAIFAGDVSYVVDAQDLKEAGIKASVDEVIDSSANATFVNSGRKLVIKQKFNPPTQVCIKVAEIETVRGGDGAAAAKLRSLDDQSLPRIRKIGS